MKRFIALVVMLSLMAGLRAEVKEACKCAEGQENCPCLAQSEEATKDQRILFSDDHAPEKPLRPYVHKADLSKWALQKRAACMEERKLRAAKAALKKQLRLLQVRSSNLPITKKRLLLARRVAIKRSCLEMKMRIKAAVLKVREMKRAYKEICKRRTKQIILRTIRSVRVLSVKIRRMKEKVKTLKAAIRLASDSEKHELVLKLKHIVANIVTSKEQLKAQKAKVVKIRAMVKKRLLIKKQKKIHRLQLALTKIHERAQHNAEIHTTLVVTLKAIKHKARVIKSQLNRASSADERSMTLIHKLKHVLGKVQELKSKLSRNEKKRQW